ncbi:MAG: hypothetical protein ACLRQF_12870 [Thomasclavelia ramosa]
MKGTVNLIDWGMGMMKYMQRLGKSLMLPVSVMPIAGIIKGIRLWIDPTG